MKTNLSLNTGTLLHAGNQTLCNVESKSLQFQIFVICHPFGSILVLILLMMTYLSDPLLHNLDKINSKNIKPNTTLNLQANLSCYLEALLTFSFDLSSFFASEQ